MYYDLQLENDEYILETEKYELSDDILNQVKKYYDSIAFELHEMGKINSACHIFRPLNFWEKISEATGRNKDVINKIPIKTILEDEILILNTNHYYRIFINKKHLKP